MRFFSLILFDQHVLCIVDRLIVWIDLIVTVSPLVPQVTASPIADGLQILSIFNFPPKSVKETLDEVTKVLKSKSTKHSEVELVRQDLVSKKTVALRFNQHAKLQQEAIQAALDKVQHTSLVSSLLMFFFSLTCFLLLYLD